MDNQEAIRRIKEFGLYHAIGDLPNSAKTVEAFNMAIEALSEKRIEEKTTGISIKNMKMPPNCMECSLCYDMIYCTITGTHMNFAKMNHERLDDCPLEEHNICKGGTND